MLCGFEMFFCFSYIIIDQMTSRFNDTLDILLLMPASVVSSKFRHKEELWVDQVVEAVKEYRDEIPDPITMKTDLRTWHSYW